ncbi:MAG: hypothetical protein CUN49_05595 [Candidatus Thermofonsia Clade 1 bacterium]|jgi:hypothetical protein|uniref:Peptidase MA-like domain-containing protein n=1 Tax=Candidatus Thermofonsia Clade 1 bacterium TaxID=2364210 RepID=A0A2M8PFU2_9CHLR|nr:MAG: hypothetical protein CUN49_05595 [Candidatus Thermofonsia Clade 1 bacterium]PJF42946.1 MAG: hypothetical protein CUN50_02165 [Candidatus Thermofonsia Clade 1 bacterium]
MRRFRAVVSKILIRLALLTFAAAFAFIVPGDTPPANTRSDRVLGYAKDALYNYVAWLVGAIGAKLGQAHADPTIFMPESARSAFVVEHLARVAELQTLNSDLERALSNGAAHLTALIARRDALAAQVARETPLAEAIIESQVAAVLREEGFTLFGEVFPPVSARFTALPALLVISPRDRIVRELTVNLNHLPPEAISALEARLEAELDVSALITPIGGLALFPSMVIQTWHAPFLIETVAHEWAHHYLLFFPLGWDYASTSETWIINETTASLFGKEVGRKVVERYYSAFPQVLRLLPPMDAALSATPMPTATPDPRLPRPFDAAAVLDATRRRVDALLAEGQIAEAEAFMEAQRKLLAQNGYFYRRINQAFFAFYGGYQLPSGGGAGGADPIGPSVAALRRHAPSLRAWLEQMRFLTTRQALLDACARLP